MVFFTTLRLRWRRGIQGLWARGARWYKNVLTLPALLWLKLRSGVEVYVNTLSSKVEKCHSQHKQTFSVLTYD